MDCLDDDSVLAFLDGTVDDATRADIDFKPQNVMIGRDGSVRVMDFGLASDRSGISAGDAVTMVLAGSGARPTSTTIALTKTGTILGTPLYMAPEQFVGRLADARTDQFGFCVALYEALYGERPFASDTLQTLTEAVVSGQARDPGERKTVPPFLRKLVLRGLRRDPSARYPSMRQLIDGLQTDPARRRRTVALAAAVATVGIVAVLGAHRVAATGPRMCGGANEKLDGIWEPTPTGRRRAAVHDALSRTGHPLAADSWTRVAGLFDGYARDWSAAYTDACKATHVRGDQSDEVRDLRMSCLGGARRALGALTDVLSNADDRAVVEAVKAAHALPSLDRLRRRSGAACPGSTADGPRRPGPRGGGREPSFAGKGA